MARLYAGLLGLLAFLTTLVRGMLHGGEPQAVLWSAWCHLLAFALLGALAGWTARWIVEDAMFSRYGVVWSARRKRMAPVAGSRREIGE